MNKKEFKEKLGDLLRDTIGMKDEEITDTVNEVFGWDVEITAKTGGKDGK